MLGSHSFESSGSAGREAAGRGRPKKEFVDSEVVLSLSNWRFVRDALQEGLTEFKPVTVQDIDVSIKMSCSLYRNSERQSEWPYFDKYGLTISYTALLSLISDPKFHQSLMAPLKEKYEQDIRRPVLPSLGNYHSPESTPTLTNANILITAGAQEQPLESSDDENNRWTGRSRPNRGGAGLSEPAAKASQSKKKQAKDSKAKSLSQGKKTAAKGRKPSQAKIKKVARALLPDLNQASGVSKEGTNNEEEDDELEEGLEEEPLPDDVIIDGLRVARTLTPALQLFSSDSELSESERDTDKGKRKWTGEESQADLDLSATPPEQTGSNYKGSLNPKDCPGGPIAVYDVTPASPVKKKKTRGKN